MTVSDPTDFEQLVEPYQRELHAHCYRMLGSAHDADDAMQETLLRAWRAFDRFEGRSSMRTWLYTIATNACLTFLDKRKKRVLPVEYGPATAVDVGPGAPVVESVWIEPYPDENPDTSYELRESLELAFIAALQHLPASQRAILILREVLGFSAAETAETLDVTVAAVNSGLQRARAAVEARVPEQSQQETLRQLGDAGVRELVQKYMAAWEANDVDAVVGMLAEDASISMPPLASWFGPRDVMAAFLRAYPMSGIWQWKAVVTSANGQPALAFYTWDEAAQTHLPFALNVLTLEGDKVVDVVAFAVKELDAVATAETYHHWPTLGVDERRRVSFFERFGVPATVD